MVTSSFGGAALGVSQARAPTWGCLTLGLPCPCPGYQPSPRTHIRTLTLGLTYPCPGCQPSPPPHVRTPSAWLTCTCAGSDQAPRAAGAGLLLPWVRPECQVAMGLVCPYPGREPGLRHHVGTLDVGAALPRAHS